MKPGREKNSNLFSYRSSFDSLFRVAKCTDGFHFFLYLCTQAVRNYFFSKEITKNKITSHGDIEPDFDFPLRWANRHDHNDGVVQPVVHVDSNAHVRHGSHRHGVGSDIRWCKDLTPRVPSQHPSPSRSSSPHPPPERWTSPSPERPWRSTLSPRGLPLVSRRKR